MRVMRPNVSPLDIRKRTFPARFRGLDRNEVTQYLDVVADDLEELMRTLDELERENSRLKDEVARHRESEASLKETLLMAQRNAETLRSDTEREADRILAEANRHADRVVQQALEKSAEKEKRIRELRVERKNLQLKLQGTLDMFQQVLNFDREEEDLDASVSVLRPKRKEGEAP
jgi:cell division initiation protein